MDNTRLKRLVHESHYRNRIASVIPDEKHHYVDTTTAEAVNYSLTVVCTFRFLHHTLNDIFCQEGSGAFFYKSEIHSGKRLETEKRHS